VALIQQNCQRLGLQATTICGDTLKPQQWWDGNLFDRILLDAPCTASGVIRRHPDIKYHRRPEHIAERVTLQCQLLEQCWSLLKPNGKLLYATCSLFAEENEDQIQNFVAEYDDAVELPLTSTLSPQNELGHQRAVGIQILPGEWNMDGFYYACLQKN